MKRILPIIIFAVLCTICSCSYDDEIDVVSVNVELGFPDTYEGAKDGIRVEMRDAHASTFVDSTDAQGVAHFTLPSGLYSASSSSQKRDENWRYFFNGSRDKIVVASDSAHNISLPLTMSRRRIVH